MVDRTDAATLHKFVMDRTEETATVHTDELTAYRGLPRHHETVKENMSATM